MERRCLSAEARPRVFALTSSIFLRRLSLGLQHATRAAVHLLPLRYILALESYTIHPCNRNLANKDGQGRGLNRLQHAGPQNPKSPGRALNLSEVIYEAEVETTILVHQGGCAPAKYGGAHLRDPGIDLWARPLLVRLQVLIITNIILIITTIFAIIAIIYIYYFYDYDYSYYCYYGLFRLFPVGPGKGQ